MTTSTTDTRTARLAQITGIERGSIYKILNLLENLVEHNQGQNIHLREVAEIVKSPYARQEEQIAARTWWAEISTQYIQVAKNYKEAESAFRNADYTNLEIMKMALDKAISLHKGYHQVAMLLDVSKDCPPDVRSMLGQHIREALMRYIVDMNSAISIWQYMVGTDFQSRVLELMLGYLSEMDDTAGRFCQLYHKLPPRHPIRLDVLRRLKKCATEKELREIYARMLERYQGEEKELRTISFHPDRTRLEQNQEELVQEMQDIRKRIDEICCQSVTDVNETNLADMIQLFRSEPVIEKTKEAIQDRFISYCNEQLKKDICLSQLLEMLALVYEVLAFVREPLVRDVLWQKIISKVTTKDDARKVIEVCRNNLHHEQAITLWLSFTPEFDEMIAFEQDIPHIEVLSKALLEKVETLHQAIVLSNILLRGSRMSAIEKVASLVRSFKEGLLTLSEQGIAHLDCYKGERIPLVRAILQFVQDETDFKIVKQFMGSSSNLNPEEERLLVEKALSLIGSEAPKIVEMSS